MSVSIDIIPQSESIDMYGEPDVSSAYSLSGYVSISLASSSSFFQRRKTTARFLLSSLTLTFEGQSELVTPEGGYFPLRLCSYTRELAPEEPLELSNEGHEDSDKPCTWNVVYNLPVSGWLPPSSIFGDASPREGGIRYSLHATAKLTTMEDDGKTWSFSTLCAPLWSKTRSVDARRRDIQINRFIIPPAVPASSSLFPMDAYAVRAHLEHPRAAHDPSIPLDILKNINVAVSVPEYIDHKASTIPFILRLRTSDLEDSRCRRLRVSGFTVDVRQTETYRFFPFSHSSSHYPIPTKSLQPPNKPLLNPHSLKRLYDMGLIVPQTPSAISRYFSLSPHSQAAEYQLSGDGYIFSADAEQSSAPMWYSMETTVPFVHQAIEQEKNWCGPQNLRPTTKSPHFDVTHEMHVAVTCIYDMPDSSKQASEGLHFCIPIRFAHVLSDNLSVTPSHSASSSVSSVANFMQPSVPYAMSLPAYSQLFDSNGDRKIDYSVPLPMYTPRSQASSSMETLELDTSIKEEADINAHSLASS